MDSDIRDLYASFAGAAETYREVYREENCAEAARRWRLLGKIIATMEHSAEPAYSSLLQRAGAVPGDEYGSLVTSAFQHELHGDDFCRPISHVGVHTAAAKRFAPPCATAVNACAPSSAEADSTPSLAQARADSNAKGFFSGSHATTLVAPDAATGGETTTTSAQAQEKTLKSIFQRFGAYSSAPPSQR
jgi:hypothetical protein